MVAADATRHDMQRCHWADVEEDVYINASVGTIGIAMLRKEQDRLSGEYKLAWDVVDNDRFWPQPGPTRLYNCDYVFTGFEKNMAWFQENYPEKAHLIKPRKSQPIGTMTADRVKRTDDEIINAPGRDLVLDGQNKISEQVAEVVYMWTKSDEIIGQTLRNVVKEAQVGVECSECGMRMEPMEMCPQCGSEDMQPFEVAEEAEESQVYSRPYPYGRLTIFCQDVLLYDGPNDIELDEIFPFAAYTHYRVPTRLHGYGDLALLKSNQMQADKNMAQLIDAMRITLTGYLQVPANEPAWQQVTNEPGQKIPTRIENASIARWVTPQGYNAQMHSIADDIIYRDFQRISGQTDVSVNQTPSAPDSATEVKSRDSVRNQRVGRHLNRFNEFRSQAANMHWQAMNQLYVGERPFMVQNSDRTFQAILVDVSQLPRGLTLKVEADIDQIERDKNVGQNLMMFIQNGGMNTPYAPLFLRMIGANDAEIRELMTLREMDPMYMAYQQQSMMMLAGGGMPPPQGPPQEQPSGGESQSQ